MPSEFSVTSPHKVNWLKSAPIAHRGLHDMGNGIAENTLGAVKNAIEHGYAIEVDLQPSRDGVPMVFHDYTLERLCNDPRNIRDVASNELATMRVAGTPDYIPTLSELVQTVAGKVGLVLELKGQFGADKGFVEAISRSLDGYSGDVAIMSFAHHLLKDARSFAPHLALGLTAEGDDRSHATHNEIATHADVDFLSYGIEHLDCRFVKEFAKSGRPVICWTVRNADEAVHSAKHADQITFEGFLP